jgi:hypothetical protein
MRKMLLVLVMGLLGAGCGSVPAAPSRTAPETAAAPSAAEPATTAAPSTPNEEVGEPAAADIVPEPVHDPVPEPAAAPPDAPPPPSDVPGANMHVQRVSTNGVTVEDVECRTEGAGLGGLFGAVVIGKPFADHKAQLDRCVSGPHRTRVRWKGTGGKMTEVRVLPPGPANACIERTLTGAFSPVEGVCAASVELGK